MSAIGAITGNAVFSQLEYKGARLKVGQWTLDAMDSVCTTAFLKATQMLSIMGGTPKAIAEREVALARAYALGGFGFDAILDEGGLDNDDELLTVFLHKLMVPHDATIKYDLAAEIVKNDRSAVITAVNKANPRKSQQADQSGLTGSSNQDTPASAQNNNDSQESGNPSNQATPTT